MTPTDAIKGDDALRAGLLSAAAVLLLAAATGVLTGFGEVAFLQLNRLVRGRIVFLGRHALWMAPTAAALLLSLVGALLLIVSRRWPRVRSVRVVTAVLVSLGALSLLLLVPRIHPLASAVLAAGCGSLGGRLAVRRPDLVRVLSVRIGPALIALVAVIAVGQ